MATFYFFKVNSEDMFLSNTEDKLNLKRCHELMTENTKYRNKINGEGFIHQIIKYIGTKEVITSNCAVQKRLG